MKIENKHYKLKDSNIFNLREADYNSIENISREILNAAEDIGFEVKEFGFKNVRFFSGELSPTIKQKLKILLERNSTELDLSFSIPKLINNNYVFINGRKKIPFFQIFDLPIITRGKNIKLRTNVATIMVMETKSCPFVQSTFLGKKVPLSLLFFSYYGPEEVENKFNLNSISLEDLGESLYEKLLYDLKTYYVESRDYTQDDFIHELGRFYSKYNSKQKGEDVVYALDLILKTDIQSKKFFITDSVLDELLYAITAEEISDLDLINKRVRCFEYMVTSKISKAIFDLCLSNRNSRQTKFNINSSQIISECNVSDIVQFDFAINPIDELTKLSRVSLVGPGGFDKENVPEHLRDIYPSMFGRICPVDTPDRDNCGVLQSLIPNVDLDENLKFTENYQEKEPISVPVSFVPFLEHDDQTRLQMASSQMRQAIMLQDFDPPLIKSGTEGLYTQHTQFLKVAKKDGRVTFVNKDMIIVVYDDKDVDIFDVSLRNIYVGNLDIFKIYVKQDDKFKARDILAESKYLTNGDINIGRNLLTTVGVYYGHNYEDGIVVSKRLVDEGTFRSVHYVDLSFTIPPNKVLLSLDDNEYKPLPGFRDKIKKGDPYAILKHIPVEPIEFLDIFVDGKKLETEKNIIITDCNIYANNWNNDIPQYNDWIKQKLESQIEKEKELKSLIKKYMPEKEAELYIKEHQLEKFNNVGNFKYKGEKLKGINVEMYGLFFRDIEVGDKVGNRHGNKGVISAIIDHDKMPQLENGKNADICINPLGIISRMNIGQLFELNLSMSLMDLKDNVLNMINDNKDQNEIKKYIVDYIKIIDNTEDMWLSKEFQKQLPEVINEKFITELSIIQPPFESVNSKQVKEALEYTNTKFTYKIYDSVSNQYLENELAAGYMYFFRMTHIAETKLSARSIGTYNRKTMQPLGGRKNLGGQRMGEMETACLIGHEGLSNLHEFMTTKSDCIDLKNDYIRKTLEADFVRQDESSEVPESVKLLQSYLTVIGVKR